MAQVAIGLLRQHIKPTDRIHGIVTKGGDAPNVVPDDAAAKYLVRSVLLDDLFPLRDRVFRCFEAGATATGATLSIRVGRSLTPTCGTTMPWRPCIRATLRPLAGGLLIGQPGAFHAFLYRHGQHLVADPIHPSNYRDKFTAGGYPPG